MSQAVVQKIGHNGIEWNKDEIQKCILMPSDINSITQKDFPITSKIYFTNDIWDFSEFNKSHKDNNYYKFTFESIPEPFKFYVKTRVLKNLYIYDNAVTTAKQKFKDARKFFSYLGEHNITNFRLIDVEVLHEYLSQFTDVKEKCIKDKKSAIKEIVEEFEIKNNCGDSSFDEVYNYLSKYDSDLMAAQANEGKHPLIHFPILNKIVSQAIQDMNNEQLSKTYRMVACMEIILAETGMRIGEFHKLQINTLDEVKLSPEDEPFYYLNFLTYKTTPEKDGRWVCSFMTDKAVLAYKTLIKLTECKRKITESKFLFLNEDGEIYKSVKSLNEHNIGFFKRHQNSLGFHNLSKSELENYRTWIPKEYNIGKVYWGYVIKEEVGKTFYFVTPHQYRVTCATKLYSKGYKLDWIRIHMNHLSEAMTAHYIRTAALEKEKKNLAKTLKARLNKETGILETNLHKVTDSNIKKELLDKDLLEDYTTINTFLIKLQKKKKSLNVYNDIDEIIDILYINKSPIVETELGFCARNALARLCERQKYINSINDGYYIGIHIPTIESLPFNFKRYEEKTKIINHNKNLCEEDSRYKNQYEMEVKGMAVFINKRLLPELKLLQSEIESLGIEVVKNKYENIIYIADNLSDILQEVMRWNMQKLSA
jgi:integrase